MKLQIAPGFAINLHQLVFSCYHARGNNLNAITTGNIAKNCAFFTTLTTVEQ